jgi:hypothetical protein
VRVHGCCHGLSCVCNICSWCSCGHRAIHCEILLLEAPPGFLQESQLLHTISTLTCLLSPTCSHLPVLTCLFSLDCSHLTALTYRLSLTYLSLALRALCSLALTYYISYLLPILHPLSYPILTLRRLLTHTPRLLWRISSLSLTLKFSSIALFPAPPRVPSQHTTVTYKGE